MDIFNRYIKYTILLLVIILLGEIAFYLFFTSEGVGNKSLTLFGPSEDSLKVSIADETAKIEKYKKDIEDTLKRTKINLNYFNKDRTIENISPLLEDLRKYSEEANVPILSVEPQPVEKYDNYLKRSFYISLRGDYKDIVRFVSALEHKGGFSTDNFEITTGTGKRGEEKGFKFSLSAFKIVDSKIPVIEDWFGLEAPVESPANDPFKSVMDEIADSIKESEQLQAANRLLDMHKKDTEDTEADLSSLTLEAVADINGTKTAIINHNILREGDSYEGFVIKRVDADSVSLTKDGKAYTLKLYSISPLVQDNKRIDMKMGQKKDETPDAYAKTDLVKPEQKTEPAKADILSQEEKKVVLSAPKKAEVPPLNIPAIHPLSILDSNKPNADSKTADLRSAPHPLSIPDSKPIVKKAKKTDRIEFTAHPLSLPEEVVKPKKNEPIILTKAVFDNKPSALSDNFSVVVVSCVYEDCAKETEKRLSSQGVSSFKRHKLNATINTYSVILDTPLERSEADRLLSEFHGVVEFRLIDSEADRFILKSKSFVYKKMADSILNKIKEKGYPASITMDREERLVNKVIVSGFDSYLKADNMSAGLKTAGFDPTVYKDEELFK